MTFRAAERYHTEINRMIKILRYLKLLFMGRPLQATPATAPQTTPTRSKIETGQRRRPVNRYKSLDESAGCAGVPNEDHRRKALRGRIYVTYLRNNLN
jgi:hypothetical protein